MCFATVSQMSDSRQVHENVTGTKSCQTKIVAEYPKKQVIEQFGARSTFYRYFNLATQIQSRKKPGTMSRLIDSELLELMHKLKKLVEKGYLFGEIKDLVVRREIKLDD